MAKTQAPALAGLSALLKKGKPKAGTQSLDDGTYQGMITNVTLGMTQKKKPQVDWTLKVISGEFENRVQHKYDMIVTQENIDWLFGTLDTLGVEDLPTSDAELKNVLKDQVGKAVEFSCRSTGDFTNVYINELLEGVDSEDIEDDEDEDEEEAEETEEEVEEEDDEEVSFSKGDRVVVYLNDEGDFDDNGEAYAGKLTAVDADNQTATIKCDDGDVLKNVDFANITAE